MDFHLKQKHKSEEQHQDQEPGTEHEQQEQEQEPPCAKIPKLLCLDQQLHSTATTSTTTNSTITTALPLFVTDQPTPSKFCTSYMSAFPDSTIPLSRSCLFSVAQWQELELQALIYRYILAGAVVPPELLQPIKKSLLYSSSSPYFLHHPLQHFASNYYQPAWYWGRSAMDPEPGRCRRTDGKKWRCSRDVVPGQKYCERHVHRGRNRSRKPVEIPTPATTTTSITTASMGGGGSGSGGGGFNRSTITVAAPSLAVADNGTGFSISGQSPSNDLFHLNRCSNSKHESNEGFMGQQIEFGNKSDGGRILRPFFDDWPRSVQESDNVGLMNSSTYLSISMPGNLSSSDVSLKLATGNGEAVSGGRGESSRELLQPRSNWGAGWGASQVASMGNPLAEALRSSLSNSSPTSVLHQVPRGTALETSFVSS